MNARLLIKMSVVVLLLSPVWAAAQVLIWWDPLPDLVPVDMTLDTDCRIIVTLHNNGPGIVPSSGYVGPATGIQMYNDGAPWGGVALGALDTAHLTQPAGGSVTWAWFSSLPLPYGDHQVTLQVDNSNSVVEANEGNNTLTKTLSCQPPAPDLVPVSIGLTSQCQLVVTLMNIGTGPLADAAFALPDGSAIQMYSDGAPFGGIALGALDFTKQLQPVGGSITYNWFSSLKLTPGGHVVSLVVDRDNTIFELNEGNNTLTRTLWCGGIIRFPTKLQP